MLEILYILLVLAYVPLFIYAIYYTIKHPQWDNRMKLIMVLVIAIVQPLGVLAWAFYAWAGKAKGLQRA